MVEKSLLNTIGKVIPQEAEPSRPMNRLSPHDMFKAPCCTDFACTNHIFSLILFIIQYSQSFQRRFLLTTEDRASGNITFNDIEHISLHSLTHNDVTRIKRLQPGLTQQIVELYLKLYLNFLFRIGTLLGPHGKFSTKPKGPA